MAATTKKRATRTTGASKRAEAGQFSAEERAAMRERAKELKAEARASRDRAAGEAELLALCKAMPKPDRTLGEHVHALMREHAPDLLPRTWYGMPAWARDGKVVVFFQAVSKFKTRYATLGFNDAAMLDDGPMWPTSYALLEIGAKEEAVIAGLLRRAFG